MPNWFSGSVNITGSEEYMKPFVEWAKQYDEDNHEDCKPFNSLFPLPSMGDTYDDEKWDYYEALDVWGSKWGVCRPTCVDFDDTSLSFGFESAWSMPDTMFWSIEKKYGVKIKATGYELGSGFVSMYWDKKEATKDILYIEFPDWYAEHVENCDVSTLPPFDEDTDICEWNDECFEEWESQWLDDYIDTLEPFLEEFKPTNWSKIIGK